MHPARGRMPDQPTLLPSGRFGVIAGREMRTADTDHIVECERVVWRQVERYLESFYRRNGVPSIRVDPTAAAPGPCRSAVERQRLANDRLRGIEFAQQRQGITDNRKNGRAARVRLGGGRGEGCESHGRECLRGDANARTLTS